MKSKINVGVICDLTFFRSICFSNYYHAVTNLFENVKIITCVNDLENIDLIVMGNDHFGPHQAIWNNDQFINLCNERGIKLFVITAEFIHSSWNPSNPQIQKDLEKFNFLNQKVVDTKDAIILSKKIASVGCSKYFNNKIVIPETKLNKCVFFGKMYQHRADQIAILRQSVDIDIIPYNEATGWQEYLTTLAQYRFVFSPSTGDSNAFALRYYESLLVDSIPIHQIKDNSLEYYTKEAAFEDVIYYTDISEVAQKIKNCAYERCNSKIWLEDELAEWFNENNIKPTHLSY
jgi:hypothetical protein